MQGLRRRFPNNFRIAIIADLDKKSKMKDAKGKEAWHSKYMTVCLHIMCAGALPCIICSLSV